MEKSREKFRSQMEDEMSRFVVHNIYLFIIKFHLMILLRFEAEISGAMMGINSYNTFNLPGFGNVPPPPMPPVMIPQQIARHKKANAHGSYEIYSQNTAAAQPAVVSAKPTIYNSAKAVQSTASAPSVDLLSLQSEVEKKLKKLKNEKVSAELAISQGALQKIFKNFSC